VRKVIVTNIVSLDGYYADPDGNPLALNMDSAFDAYNLERMRSAGTILLGRRSFEMFSSYWPMIADAPEDPNNRALSAVNREFSRRYNDIPKLVVSDGLEEVPPANPWHDTTEVVPRATIATRLGAERADAGGDIAVFASRTLWNTLLSDGVLDELHLVIGPAAIGAGIPLFDGPAELALIDGHRLDGSDNALLRYAAARPVDPSGTR
jgi:dihydrofolate reductase